MAKIKDFYRGDTRKYRVIVRNKLTGNPISVHNGTLYITFKVNQDDEDSDAVIRKIIPTTEADPANPTGEIRAVLTASDTNVEPGTYYYDFQFVNSAGEVTTILPEIDAPSSDKKVKIGIDISRTV